MAISDWNTTQVERQWFKVLTVDPSTRHVSGVTASGDPVQVAIWEVPPIFRWPVEGEWWMATRENGYWHLRGRMQPPEDVE